MVKLHHFTGTQLYEASQAARKKGRTGLDLELLVDAKQAHHTAWIIKQTMIVSPLVYACLMDPDTYVETVKSLSIVAVD